MINGGLAKSREIKKNGKIVVNGNKTRLHILLHIFKRGVVVQNGFLKIWLGKTTLLHLHFSVLEIGIKSSHAIPEILSIQNHIQRWVRFRNCQGTKMTQIFHILNLNAGG